MNQKHQCMVVQRTTDACNTHNDQIKIHSDFLRSISYCAAVSYASVFYSLAIVIRLNFDTDTKKAATTKFCIGKRKKKWWLHAVRRFFKFDEKLQSNSNKNQTNQSIQW